MFTRAILTEFVLIDKLIIGPKVGFAIEFKSPLRTKIKGEVGIFLPTNETNNPNFPVGENEIFGEMGVIEDTLRSAGARCMTDCVVISLSKQEYEKKLNESDPFIKGLLRLLSIRLREMTKPKTLGSK